MWVSLIGFMGSGKSSVAALLAERAVEKAIDLDDVMAEQTGMSIAQIFSEQGEAVFRELETKTLAELPANEDLVVACGGGIVERQENRELLRGRGIVIWLDLPWETQRARLESIDTDDRPLIVNHSWREIEDLHRRRRILYARTAHFRLRGDQATADILAHQVLIRRLNWEKRRREGDA